MGRPPPGPPAINELTHRIIGAAIAVHRQLGPGLLESLYQEAMALELRAVELGFEAQKAIPAFYRGVRLNGGYRIDLLVEGKAVVELEAVDRLEPVFTAQLLTYLKLTSCQVGLLINVHAPLTTSTHSPARAIPPASCIVHRASCIVHSCIAVTPPPPSTPPPTMSRRQ